MRRLVWLAMVVWPVLARAEPLAEAGNWLTQDRMAVVAIAGCDSGLCGRVVGIHRDHEGDRLPLDVWGHSPCGEAIISMKRRVQSGRWQGTIVDPRTGHRYSAQLWPVGAGLRLRGYIGLPILGGTQSWTRFTGDVGPECHVHI